jgi:hypothetical protein
MCELVCMYVYIYIYIYIYANMCEVRVNVCVNAYVFCMCELLRTHLRERCPPHTGIVCMLEYEPLHGCVFQSMKVHGLNNHSLYLSELLRACTSYIRSEHQPLHIMHAYSNHFLCGSVCEYLCVSRN